MIKPTSTLADVLDKEPKLAFVVFRYGISLDNPKKELSYLCEEIGIDTDFFIQLLNLYRHPDSFEATDFKQYPLESILKYLKKTHIFFLRKRLPEIELTIKNLVQHYSEENPAFLLLNHFYSDYKTNLIKHIEEEEKHLFPLAQRIFEGKATSDEIENGLLRFEHEHNDYLGQSLKEASQAVSRHSSDNNEPSLFRVFLSQIENFQQDLTIHHLIEEDVLVPRIKEEREPLVTIKN